MDQLQLNEITSSIYNAKRAAERYIDENSPYLVEIRQRLNEATFLAEQCAAGVSLALSAELRSQNTQPVDVAPVAADRDVDVPAEPVERAVNPEAPEPVDFTPTELEPAAPVEEPGVTDVAVPSDADAGVPDPADVPDHEKTVEPKKP